MVSGRRSDSVARWWRRLLHLVPVVAMAIAALAAAARAEEVFPKAGSHPKVWSNDIPEMRFVVVRSNAPGCEPNCPEWISAEGTIEAGTPAQLKRTLKALGRRQLPVIVNSPGGNVEAALQLGRMIRKARLDIAVGVTDFSGCWPGMKDCRDNEGKAAPYFGSAFDGGAMCNSACPLMFAGGVHRMVGNWAFLGVHQITTTYRREQVYYRTTYRIVNGRKKVLGTKVVSRKDAGSYKTYEMSKSTEKRLSAYLKEMGIGAGVLKTMKATPASDIHRIDLDDMLAMNLVTSKSTVAVLTSASLCNPVEPAQNCRKVPEPAGKPAMTASVAPTTAATDVKPPAVAATPPAGVPREMRFVVVRGSNPLCNPDCPEWISAEGAITPQTPQKLRQLLATLGDRRLPVVINSRGGDLFGALIAGRLIHERKLDVAVAHTDFVGCDPSEWNCLAEDGAYSGLSVDSGAECDSACGIMLAGGARRLVGSQARLSMYLMGHGQIVKAYLEEMAIGPGLFAAIEQHPVERQIEPDLLLKVGLTTGPQSADALTGAGVCKVSPKPANCRGFPAADAAANAPRKL
ncbi:MAG: hypothetical protein ABS57_17860 [Mesorhizobium sp. SCN 65-12]|nr:MAG: hypothetical protein ABS57_17860 [Mesorhizobium sp. SCN 65-12]